MARPQPPADFVRRVALQIARTRARAGITQEALATALDTATKNVQRLESGRQNLTLRTIERVAAALQVAPEQFFVAAGPSPAGTPRERSAFQPMQRLAERGYETSDGEARKPPGFVPVTTLAAAAGALARGQAIVERLGWVRVPHRSLAAGWFVAKVDGESMAPRVPDGALCLFRPVVGSLPLGRTVLVEHRAIPDSGLPGSIALKTLARVERRPSGRIRVTLDSDNPRFAPIVLSLDDPEDLRVVAELCEVLVAGDGA